MDEAFLFIYWVLGINGDGNDEQVHPTHELIEQMRADPAYLAEQKAFREHMWRNACRDTAELLIQLFMLAARYLSDVIGGDVPLLAPRDVVEASAGVSRRSDADAFLVGKSMQRAIQTQLGNKSHEMTEAILAQIQQLVTDRGTQAVPVGSRFLDTKQMAARLNISKVTVARLCRKGSLDADKTSGNQWRTTEERLQRSRYLKGKKRGGGGNGQLE